MRIALFMPQSSGKACHPGRHAGRIPSGLSLPPPAAGAFGFARRDGAGAGGAADGDEALGVEGVDGHLFGDRQCRQRLARLVKQRIDLEQAIAGIDRGKAMEDRAAD